MILQYTPSPKLPENGCDDPSLGKLTSVQVRLRLGAADCGAGLRGLGCSALGSGLEGKECGGGLWVFRVLPGGEKFRNGWRGLLFRETAMAERNERGRVAATVLRAAPPAPASCQHPGNGLGLGSGGGRPIPSCYCTLRGSERRRCSDGPAGPAVQAHCGLSNCSGRLPGGVLG